MRTRDWAATPIGPPGSWPESLRTLVSVMLGSAQPMFVAWGEQRTLLYNDSYAELLRDRHPAALGKPFGEVWWDIMDDVGPILDAALAGTPTQMDDIALDLTGADGVRQERHFSFSYTPVREGGSVIPGMFCACQEITGRIEAERALRDAQARESASEVHLQTVLDSVSDVFYAVDSDWNLTVCNRAAEQFFHIDAATSIGSCFLDALGHGDYDRERLLKLYRRAAEAPLTAPSIVNPGRVVDFRAAPLPAGGWAVSFTDVTDRSEAVAKLQESEERYRALFETIDEGFCIIEFIDGPNGPLSDYVHVEANPAYERNAGIADVVGQNVREMVPDEAESWVERYRTVLETGTPIRFEQELEATGRFLELSAYRVEPESKRQVAVLFQDVTARRLAEEALAARTDELEQVMSAAPAAIWIGRNSEGGAIEANAMGHRILGLDNDAPMEIEGPPDGNFTNGRFVHPDGRPYARKEFPLARAIAGERLDALEVEIVYDDSPPRHLLINAQPFGEGDQGGAVAVGIDITERKRLEEELRALNAHLAQRVEEALTERSIFANIIDETDAFVQVAAPDFTYLAVNRASAKQFQRLFGVEPKAGDNFLDVLAKWPEHRDYARALWARAFAGESFTEIREFALRGIDRRSFESRFHPLRDADGSVIAAYQFVTEITDRVRNEARLRAIFDTTFQFQGLADIDGTLLEANKASLEAIGCEPEDVIGRKVWDTPWFAGKEGLAETVELAVRHVIQTKRSHTRETTLNLLGEDRIFNISMRPMTGPNGEVVGLITEANEITALRAAEAALLQAQKLEGMGQLTGGVAHDFNNLLTPILGALDLLQRRGLGNELERSLIEGAMQSAERARTLVQRLLAFARRQPLRAVAVDIGRLVEGMADLVSRTTGPQVRVVTEVAPELPSAMADANQLELAILNLAVNARDAMPGGGTLRISASETRVDTLDGAKVQPGRYVVLSVADDGSGMDEATQARAIEPFFSTKGIGQGTGLGLSMAHGLASQLGGALTIDSHPGVGTNIQLWLPATERAVESETSAPEVAVRTAKGVALLVDDEPLVRASTAEMLNEIGFDVVEADSGEAAMTRLEGGLEPDILVTDHLMPGMDGTQLAHAAAGLMPGIKVLVVSGYAEREGIDPALARLAKPFRSADLIQALTALGATERN